MGDESAKRAAEEYLATKLSAETQSEEKRLNREAAERLATSVWKHLADMLATRCKEWNEVAGEQALTCRETMWVTFESCARGVRINWSFTLTLANC